VIIKKKYGKIRMQKL